MIHNLWIQLFPTNAAFQLFYLPYNILSGLAVFIYFKAKTPLIPNVSFCAIVLIALHFIVITTFQNYARYLLVSLPAILISGIIGFDKSSIFRNIKAKQITLYAIICLLIVLNIPLIIRSHRKGLEEKKIRSEVKMVFDETIPVDDSVIITYEHKNLLLAYTLRPRNVIYVKPIYTTEEFIAMKEKSNAKWLICESTSPILNAFSSFSPTAVMDLPRPYDNYTLFKFGSNERYDLSKETF